MGVLCSGQNQSPGRDESIEGPAGHQEVRDYWVPNAVFNINPLGAWLGWSVARGLKGVGITTGEITVGGLVIAVGGFIWAAAAWWAWSRLRRSGYYLTSVYLYLALVAGTATLLASPRTPGLAYDPTGDAELALPLAAGYVLLWILFFGANLWLRGLRRFFAQVNGRCPGCRRVPLPRVKKDRAWTCRACGVRFKWRRREA